MSFKRLSRVRLSKEWLNQSPRANPDRMGTIVSSERSFYPRVVWDGNVCPSSYHPSFLELVIPEEMPDFLSFWRMRSKNG
jgi:hypothetical protein